MCRNKPKGVVTAFFVIPTGSDDMFWPNQFWRNCGPIQWSCDILNVLDGVSVRDSNIFLVLGSRKSTPKVGIFDVVNCGNVCHNPRSWRLSVREHSLLVTSFHWLLVGLDCLADVFFCVCEGGTTLTSTPTLTKNEGWSCSRSYKIGNLI